MELTPSLVVAIGTAAAALAGAGGWVIRGGARGSQSAQQRIEGVRVDVGSARPTPRPECSIAVADLLGRHSEVLAQIARTNERLADAVARQTTLLERIDRQIEQDGWRFRSGRTIPGGGG